MKGKKHMFNVDIPEKEVRGSYLGYRYVSSKHLNKSLDKISKNRKETLGY